MAAHYDKNIINDHKHLAGSYDVSEKLKTLPPVTTAAVNNDDLASPGSWLYIPALKSFSNLYF